MKVTKIEKEKRIRIVQEWILEDHHTNDIVRNCMSKWEVGDRQARRYIADAFENFAAINETKVERQMSYHLQRRRKLLRDLPEDAKKTPAGINTQLSILQDIAKLQQLYKVQLQISTPEGETIRVKHENDIDYTKLPTNVLEAIVNARK